MVLRGRGIAAPLAAGALAGAALAGATVAAAEYVVHAMTRPTGAGQSQSRGFTPFETGVEWEEVSFPTEDGTRLAGWLLARDPQAPAVLACGGYRGRRADLLGISSALWRAGISVLLFDYRGHGGDPAPVTLGYRELADARAALRWLRARGPSAPIGAIGFSMGAAVAIMLAAREPVVRAVWADSPFSSQRDILGFQMASHAGLRPTVRTAPLANFMMGLIDRRLARRFGFRLDDIHPLRDVGRMAPRPLYVVHGEEDVMVPVSHGRRLAEAAAASGVPVETWFLPGVGHCGAYFVDRPAYCDRTIRFFHEHLRSEATDRSLERAVAD